MQKCDSMRNAVHESEARSLRNSEVQRRGLSQKINRTEVRYLLESVHHPRCFPQLGSLGIVGVETQRFFQVVLGFIHLSDAQKGVASVTQNK